MMKMLLAFVGVGLFTVNTCRASGGPWEFAALYHLTGPNIGTSNITGDYTLLFFKQKEEYADPAFNVSYAINSEEGGAGIEAAEDAAKALWEGVPVDVDGNDYGSSSYLSKDTFYQLKFDDKHPVSAYRFKFSSTESTGADCGEDCHFIFFLQHFPSEFDMHLFDANGVEIIAEATEPATPGETKKRLQ